MFTLFCKVWEPGNKRTALMYAARGGHEDMVRFLYNCLEDDEDASTFIRALDRWGKSALQYAIDSATSAILQDCALQRHISF